VADESAGLFLRRFGAVPRFILQTVSRSILIFCAVVFAEYPIDSSVVVKLEGIDLSAEATDWVKGYGVID